MLSDLLHYSALLLLVAGVGCSSSYSGTASNSSSLKILTVVVRCSGFWLLFSPDFLLWQSPPFLVNNNGTLSGFIPDFLKILNQSANFTYTLTLEQDRIYHMESNSPMGRGTGWLDNSLPR